MRGVQSHSRVDERERELLLVMDALKKSLAFANMFCGSPKAGLFEALGRVSVGICLDYVPNEINGVDFHRINLTFAEGNQLHFICDKFCPRYRCVIYPCMLGRIKVGSWVLCAGADEGPILLTELGIESLLGENVVRHRQRHQPTILRLRLCRLRSVLCGKSLLFA